MPTWDGTKAYVDQLDATDGVAVMSYATTDDPLKREPHITVSCRGAMHRLHVGEEIPSWFPPPEPSTWPAPLATRPVTFTLDEVEVILRNLGVDIECGACASIAYTGAALAPHTCREERDRNKLIHQLREVDSALGAALYCCPTEDNHAVHDGKLLDGVVTLGHIKDAHRHLKTAAELIGVELSTRNAVADKVEGA